MPDASTQKWLAKIGVGGVQRFIAQARKLGDLRAGSEIIVQVMAAMSDSLRNDPMRVILPAAADATEQFGDAAPPQQLLLELIGDENQVRGVLEKLEKAARDTWSNLLSTDVAFVKSLLQVYWVAVPCSAVYEESYESVQAAYEARRHTRDFPAEASTIKYSGKPSGSRTCTLCGVRTATCYPTNSAWKSGELGIGRERFCGVCAGKRRHYKKLAEDAQSGIASTHRLGKYRFNLDSRFAAVRAGKTEKQWCKILDDLEDMDDAGAMKNILNGNNRLQSQFESLPSYYAIVYFDADQMGKWFGGEFKSKNTQLRDLQTALSKSLHLFNTLCKRDLSDPTLPIYLGGDEGLIACPLDYLLLVLSRIHKAWNESVKSFSGMAGKLPTITAHATILHAKSPLQPAVARLQSLLDEAKTIQRSVGAPGGISVLADLHSGSDARFIGSWSELESLTDSVEAFSNWRASDVQNASWPGVEELNNRSKRALPRRYLQKAADIAPAFLDGDTVQTLTAYRMELERLAGQSAREKSVNAFLNWIKVTASPNSVVEASNYTPHAPATRVDNVLSLIGFLARTLNWETPLP